MADSAVVVERELATIDIVLSIIPIDGANSIELVQIRGWRCVVRIGEFQVGDLCVYFEIDSLLPSDLLPPDSPVAKIMKQSKYRVKTKKLLGQISQGLALPLSMFPMIDDPILFRRKHTSEMCAFQDALKGHLKRHYRDMDVTALLGIKKYEPILVYRRGGMIKMSKFPSGLIKTSCDRIQNLQKYLTQYAKLKWNVSEKIDGCSVTIGYLNDKFIVCSRNLEVFDSKDPGNYWWRVVHKYDLTETLREHPGLIIQGEIIAPKLQKNRYKLLDVELHVFRCHDVSNELFLGRTNLVKFCDEIGLKVVPLMKEETTLDMLTLDEWLTYAEGESTLKPGVIREGVVLSPITDIPTSQYQTIKIISNAYLLGG
jgi:RNA ligase (TIGR02306 family)